MPSPERLKTRTSEINPSTQLDAVLRKLAASGNLVDTLTLLKAIQDQPASEGRRALQSLVTGFNKTPKPTTYKGKVKITLANGSTFVGDSRVAEILATAAQLARGAIKTGDILAAESKLEDSYIMANLKSGIKPDRKIVPSIVNVLRGLDYQAQIKEGKATIATAEITRLESNLKILDLLAAAKANEITNSAAKDDWVRDTLMNLGETNILAIISNNQEEATSVVEGLALALSADKDQIFGYRSLIAINPEYLEKNPDLAIAEAIQEAKSGILYLPNLDSFIDSPSLKAAIAAGDPKIITSTPPIPQAEYRKKDRVLNSAKVLSLSPMSAKEAEMILVRGQANLETTLSNGQKITITPEAIAEACRLANRYQTVLELTTIQGAKLLIQRAASLIKLEVSPLDVIKNKFLKADLQIDPEDISLALKDLKGIDAKPDDLERYKQTSEVLKQDIVGQDETLQDIAEAILRAKTGFNNPKRPLGSFLFLGPSGVGKSETAKVLAKFLFGSADELIVLNMSEFSEEHTVSALLGSPVGYKGSEQGGRLTEAVSKKPYAVLVLDEIEKADPAVRLALLRLLEEGTIEDRSGKLIDCRNLVIIATSNILTADIAATSLRPEFVNRFDKVEVFNALSIENLEKIVDIQLKPTQKLLGGMGVNISVTPEARTAMAKAGFDPKFGARPLRRLIEQKVVNQLAQMKASGKLNSGTNLSIELQNNQIVLVAK